MHELSISRAIVDAAVRHAAGRRVSAVHLRVGALRQVVPETLAFAFGIASRGTLCEGAHLEQVEVKARVRCEDCGARWALETLSFRCPRCDGVAVGVASGEELTIDWIEVEERCIA